MFQRSLEDSGTLVLKDINFELEEGKFYTLLGASGSGKRPSLISLPVFDSDDWRCLPDGERINDVPTNKRDTPSFSPMPCFHI